LPKRDRGLQPREVSMAHDADMSLMLYGGFLTIVEA
jgi:hypothetical protein